MFLKVIIVFKSLLARNIFIWNIVYNCIQIVRHFAGYPRYYLNFILKKPYIGGYLFTKQEFLRGRHSVIKKSLDFLINFSIKENKSINILEIGSYAGESTLMFCEYLKKKNYNNFKIYCVDLWDSFEQKQMFRKSFIEVVSNRGLKTGKIFNIFKRNIQLSGFADKIIILKGSSLQLVPAITDVNFDYVYIDGAHNYLNVLSDIKSTIKLLNQTAIIAGDDYELTYDECDKEKIKNYILEDSMDYCVDTKTKKIFHPGVTQAVHDVFGSIPSHNGCWIQLKINEGFKNIDLVEKSSNF